MIGKRSVPDAEVSDIVGRTCGCLTNEAFVIAFTFKNGTISEDDAGTNDSLVGIVVVLRSIIPNERGEIFSIENLVGVLVIVVSLFDGRW